MDQVLSNDYSSAAGANEFYTRHRDRWEFLLNSYVGGEEYRNAGYLTRYQLESESEYNTRLYTTPLDNQCKSIIATYISFLFRLPADRFYGRLANDPGLDSFIYDTDWEGRDIDSFMKQASIWANVFGHSWIIMSKPQSGSITRADEMAQGVRPYLNLLTPLTVTDWRWSRRLNGSYELSYFKYVEDSNDSVTVVKEWTKELITTSTLDDEKEVIIDRQEVINELGRIPAVILYAHTSPVRGFGLSTIADIADAQKMIYNLTSEVEQAVRLGSHPSLVKTRNTQAGAGAGSIIEMEENLDPNLKPYVLEFSGQEISSVYTAIDALVNAIDKMANTGAIRATETRTMSGVSREVEFQLLNARLSEQADNIELAEEQLWELYAQYQGTDWDGEINYPDSFAIKDTDNELDQLIKTRNAVTDPVVIQAVDTEIVELLDLPVPDNYVVSTEPYHVMPDGTIMPGESHEEGEQ